MSNARSNKPSSSLLGKQLRTLREKRQESLAEVSGAVEIETESLLSIEQGIDLPGEDILLLLISHFDLKKDEAIQLWRLAGYDKLTSQFQDIKNEETTQSSLIVVPVDNRILYTDLVNISTNNYGLVMNFLQTNGNKNNPAVSVARVGMSKEHAKSVLTVLKKVLTSDQRTIDQSTRKTQNKKKKEQN